MSYAGSSWIETEIKPEVFSDLGKDVADFLGDLFRGIYHLDVIKLHDVDWGNDHHIEFALGWKTLSTYDDPLLTFLVLLAHERAIRVEICPRANKYTTLLFHRRSRNKTHGWAYHPTIQEAIAIFESHYPKEVIV